MASKTPAIQRYSDAPPAQLSIPTAPAFAASKTTAWFHRAAARDLYVSAINVLLRRQSSASQDSILVKVR
jgi:hypothetical protein